MKKQEQVTAPNEHQFEKEANSGEEAEVELDTKKEAQCQVSCGDGIHVWNPWSKQFENHLNEACLMKLRKAAEAHGNKGLLVMTNKTTMLTQTPSEKGPEQSSWQQTDEPAWCFELKDALEQLADLNFPVFIMLHGGQARERFTDLLQNLTEDLEKVGCKAAFRNVSVVLAAPAKNVDKGEPDWAKINDDALQHLVSEVGCAAYMGRVSMHEEDGKNTKREFIIQFKQNNSGEKLLSLPCWRVDYM